MSNGTYCSASQRIDSDSSSGDIAGSWIFLMMTEWPESEVAKSWSLAPVASFRRLMVSTTREESMIEPSTIASGESGSTAEPLEPVLPLALLELDQLDRRAADVETDEALRAREQHGAIYPLSS